MIEKWKQQQHSCNLTETKTKKNWWRKCNEFLRLENADDTFVSIAQIGRGGGGTFCGGLALIEQSLNWFRWGMRNTQANVQFTNRMRWCLTTWQVVPHKWIDCSCWCCCWSWWWCWCGCCWCWRWSVSLSLRFFRQCFRLYSSKHATHSHTRATHTHTHTLKQVFVLLSVDWWIFIGLRFWFWLCLRLIWFNFAWLFFL